MLEQVCRAHLSPKDCRSDSQLELSWVVGSHHHHLLPSAAAKPKGLEIQAIAASLLQRSKGECTILFVELAWTPRATGVTVNLTFHGWLGHIIITCCILLLQSAKCQKSKQSLQVRHQEQKESAQFCLWSLLGPQGPQE